MIRIRIQRGIPIPRRVGRGRNGNREPKYPWSQMQIGDSFLFPEEIGRSAHSSAYKASRGGKKFAVWKTDSGYRCWRVE